MTATATRRPAAELLRDLAAQGARVEPRGDRLHVAAPVGVLCDELRKEIREHKPELIRLLADPRWPTLRLIEDAWEAGGRIVVSGQAAHIEPREPGVSIPPELGDRLRVLERDVVACLTRKPWEEGVAVVSRSASPKTREPRIADALGGVEPVQGSLADLGSNVAEMSLEGFARSRLLLEVRSEALGETVLFAGDEARVDPERARGHAVYRGSELLEIEKAQPGAEDLRRLHFAKKTFGGAILRT